ncbi:hypothetical protein TNCV_3010471 [Trichonephila clavipes]|nr:hypothetical protein TNCV_3010471 [Trichonephila clavipes]
MGGRGWCLGSAVDVNWGRASLFSTLVLVLLLIWFPWETFSLVGSMEPQHSTLTGTRKITEFSTHRGQIRLLDVLPHQIAELSSQYRYINYFCSAEPTGSPNFLLIMEH